MRCFDHSEGGGHQCIREHSDQRSAEQGFLEYTEHITGRGGGGCIWAIGEKREIAKLKKQWISTFERRKLGFLLPVKVTGSGLGVGFKRASKVPVTARSREYD